MTNPCHRNCGWMFLPDENSESCPTCGHDPDLEEFAKQVDALSRAALTPLDDGTPQEDVA